MCRRSLAPLLPCSLESGGKCVMDDKNLIDKYLDFMEFNKGRAIGTVKNYGQHVERLAAYLQTKGVNLITAKPSDLDSFAGLVSHNAGYSASGRRPIVAALRSFYGWLYREGVTQANTSEKLPYPKPIKKLPIPIQVSNAERLLNSITLDSFINIRDAAIIAMFLGTGLRLSGLRNLNRANLYEMEVEGQPRLFLRVMEKGTKERLLPVPDVMRLFIMVYLNHEEYRQAEKVTEHGEEVLFINTKNAAVEAHEFYGERRRLSARYIQKMIHKRGEALGIPANELKPHAMRHLYGTELAENGVDLHRIQLLLGHADISTTVHYMHLAQRKLFKQVNESSPLSGMNTIMHKLEKSLKDKRA